MKFWKTRYATLHQLLLLLSSIPMQSQRESFTREMVDRLELNWAGNSGTH